MSFLSWANAMIAPPSNGHPQPQCDRVHLPPVKNLDPFNCQILPTEAARQCQAHKMKYSSAVKPDCSRLPPEYQPFCRALPAQPGCHSASSPACQTFTPDIWPNTAAAPPNTSDAFAHARQRCANLGSPREFYTCLWSSTKYPHYPEFGPVPSGECRNQSGVCPYTLTNRDNCPCSVCGARSPFGTPPCGTWIQKSDCSVWTRRK